MKKVFFWIPLTLLTFLILASPANAVVSVTAASGYWADIQNAVDQVATAGGIGNVHIPAGDWNVVNVGETWTGFLINVPTSVSVFGAPTERDADDQVVEWKTRLIIPWAASPESGSHGPFIFGFHGNEFGDDFTRISDIEFIGYYNPDHDWLTRRTYMIAAIGFDYVNEYRVDHIRTENMRYGGVKIWGREARGAIDHCSFENPVWYSQGASMSDMDIGYGVASSRIGYNFQSARERLLEYWDSDDQDVLGKYTRYSHYIEDCYFTTWRHAIASNWGAHYVVRHSTFEDDYVFGTVDAHGWGFYGCYAPDDYWCYNRGPYDTYMAENYPDWTQQEKDDYWEENKVVGWLGTRAFEVYNNTFEGPDPDRSHGSVIFARGGASVHFNNDIGLNSSGIRRYFEAGNEGTWEESWNRIWIWDNDIGPGISLNLPSNPDISVVESKPAWYAPYPYPHPLTIDSSNKHRLWGRLLDANSMPVQSEIFAFIEGTNTLITSNQTDANGNYGLEIQPGNYDIQYRVLKPGFYVPNFLLRLNSINVNTSIQNLIKTITDYPTEKKISFVANITPNQKIQTYSPIKPKRVLINKTTLTEVQSLSALTENTWYYDSNKKTLHMSVTPLIVVTAASGHAVDIQAAVNQIAAAGGGTVYIPAGTFDFEIPPEQTAGVFIPGGVNVIGAGIDSTILNQGYLTNRSTPMFKVDGKNGRPGRISGITFNSYRVAVENEPYTIGIDVHNGADYRIDHCRFTNFTSKGIGIYTSGGSYINRGVIDHCDFQNPYKDDPNVLGEGGGRKGWAYGIVVTDRSIYRDTDYYLGKYDDINGVWYIENSNFSHNRHAIASNGYAWYVVRNSEFWDPRPEQFGIIDVHGFGPGGRGLEAYDNEIHGCEYFWDSSGRWLANAFVMRAGGGVIFNNSLIDIHIGIDLVEEAKDQGRINDIWIWDNPMTTEYAPPGYTGDDGIYIRNDYGFVEGVEYHLTPRPSYKPYPYPHPLTLED